MFKVSYTLKSEDKLLSDESATFRYLKDAFVFMRELMMLGAKLVGKPMIERIQTLTTTLPYDIINYMMKKGECDA